MSFNESGKNDDEQIEIKKSSKRIAVQENAEDADSILNDRLMGVAGAGDDFRAVYWPMEKWINDKAAAEMLSAMIGMYPNLNWSNPLSAQFNAMLSAIQNIAWMNELRIRYDFCLIDFMRIVFMNWPELFTKKRYASTLSAAIVSCLI